MKYKICWIDTLYSRIHKTYLCCLVEIIDRVQNLKWPERSACKVLKIIFFFWICMDLNFEFRVFFTIDYWNCRIFLFIGKELWCLFCYCKIALFKIQAAYKILPIRIIWNITLKIYIAKIWMPKNSDGSKIPKFSLGFN